MQLSVGPRILRSGTESIEKNRVAGGQEKTSRGGKGRETRFDLTVFAGLAENTAMVGLLHDARCLGVAVLLVLLPSFLCAGERPRVWTSADGRKLTGVLEEKGEDWIKLRVKGKVYRLKLEKLSQEDRIFLRDYEIKKPLLIRTELTSHKDPDLKKTDKILNVEFRNMEKNQELYLLVMWVAKKNSDITGGGVGVMQQLECFYSRDGVYPHKASFFDNQRVGESYRGWAIRVMDMKGNTILERASADSYLGYLREAVTRQAPEAIEEDVEGAGGEPAEEEKN